MVEQQRQKLEHEITRVVDELDRAYLRKMQSDMHKCAAQCCDNGNLTMESVQRCVEGCSTKLTHANNYVQNELQHFQKRVQRCVMDCNDEIRDNMKPNPADADISKYTRMFETCAVRCVDKHLDILPTMFKTMKSVLAKGGPSLDGAVS